MKKLIYISAISFLLISMASCFVHKTITFPIEISKFMKQKKGVYQVSKKVKVLSVITKAGDTILFTKKYPCRLNGKYVFGNPEVHLPYGTIDSTDFYYTLNTIWENGIQYQFIGQDSIGYICVMKDTLYLPLTEIDRIKVIKFSLAGTILLPVSAILVSFTAAFFIHVLTCDGCWL
jgi:hypothetical protein